MTKPYTFFLASRPAFLSITMIGCFIGLGVAGGPIKIDGLVLLALILALCVHAAANLLNDYFDHLNGSDDHNDERISPFTGGSRFIQNQIITATQIRALGIALILICCILGIYICSQSTWLLMPIGILGTLLAWSYSAPPLQLMAKGALGEIAIAIAWSLVVIGFAALHTGYTSNAALFTGLSFGLMTSNILLINQIPDIDADKQARKFTLATIYTAKGLSNWYAAICIFAYAIQLTAVHLDLLPKTTLLTILILPAFWFCARNINKSQSFRKRLKVLIITNMAAVHFYSLCLLIGLVLESG